MFGHNWLAWALSLAGDIGAVGLIAAAIFAPAAAWIVWNSVKTIFVKAFSTRIGFGVIVGVAVYLATSWYQHRIDEQAYAKRTAEFRAAQAARDARIRKDTETFVRKQIADEFIAQQESDHATDEFTASLDPAGKCRVGDDAPRLRKLWELEGQH